MKKANESVGNTYPFTLSSGREFLLRPVPKHYFLMFGQLPSSLTEKAISSLGKETAQAEKEIISQLTPKQILNNMLFAREAVKYACVKPKIVLLPESEDEIAAFDLSEAEFTELVKECTSGGMAQGADSFRGR